MLKMGCFSGRIQNVPKSVGGTLGPDGKMRTGKPLSNLRAGDARGLITLNPKLLDILAVKGWATGSRQLGSAE